MVPTLLTRHGAQGPVLPRGEVQESTLLAADSYGVLAGGEEHNDDGERQEHHHPGVHCWLVAVAGCSDN